MAKIRSCPVRIVIDKNRNSCIMVNDVAVRGLTNLDGTYEYDPSGIPDLDGLMPTFQSTKQSLQVSFSEFEMEFVDDISELSQPRWWRRLKHCWKQIRKYDWSLT